MNDLPRGVSPYVIRDITDWAVVSSESMGLQPKDWVSPQEDATGRPSGWWLFKPVKEASYRRFDDQAEKISAELARLLGLPTARVELARRGVVQGIISRNVTPDGWSIQSGDVLLSDLPEYVTCSGEDRPANRLGHRVDNIARMLDGSVGPPGTRCASWKAIDVFVGYLIFDAWIANTDRHAENWAVLEHRGDGRRALAASFDHGTALASGFQDASLSGRDPARFASKGFARSFESGRRRTLVEFALSAVSEVGGLSASWLDTLANVTEEQVVSAVVAVPELSESRRTFMVDVLRENQRRLTS